MPKPYPIPTDRLNRQTGKTRPQRRIRTPQTVLPNGSYVSPVDGIMYMVTDEGVYYRTGKYVRFYASLEDWNGGLRQAKFPRDRKLYDMYHDDKQLTEQEFSYIADQESLKVKRVYRRNVRVGRLKTGSGLFVSERKWVTEDGEELINPIRFTSYETAQAALFTIVSSGGDLVDHRRSDVVNTQEYATSKREAPVPVTNLRGQYR